MNSEDSEIYKNFKANSLVWGMYYYPNHFRMVSPDFHLKTLKESDKSKYFAEAAPRGSAKSTLIGFLKPTHKIVFKLKRFIVIVQNTYNKACGTLETIKGAIRDNESIKKEYCITLKKDSEGDSVFRHPDGFETRVLVKGAEQIGSIRGEKFGAYRPDYIIVDDIEDDEMVKNPERRMYLQDLYDNALIPAGDVETLNVDVIGTILHDDSLMAKLVSKDHYKEYRKLVFRARNENKDGSLYSLWSEKWSLDWLNEFERNKPLVFAQEMQNNPVSGLASYIKKEDFRYWKVENDQYILYNQDGSINSKGSLRDCKAAIACDLAWEDKRESDFSVIMPGYLTTNSELLIDDYICKKGMKPDEIEEIIFSMEARLKKVTGKPVPIGFEKAKLEKVIKHLLRQAMARRNRFLWFKDLQWDLDKIQRIVTRLQPRYAQHSIFHRKGMGDLENQLVRVPKGTHDDLPDAEQGLVQLLEYAPKSKKVDVSGDDEGFMQVRKFAIDSKKTKKDNYTFGQKGKRFFEVPSLTSFR